MHLVSPRDFKFNILKMNGIRVLSSWEIWSLLLQYYLRTEKSCVSEEVIVFFFDIIKMTLDFSGNF